MPAYKTSKPPQQSATLKELATCPMPDMELYRQQIQRKVDSRRRLEDRRVERKMREEEGA
ncbi:hypothetical protein [Noviherbaspirillum galbum]|uniref:Uncharacterized protein n=1 Tax=Noviherbaspirillum galbum TaxID=2709383 RepID=A0A6B3SP08_9BURK|nr:hypothetical protein [Noviherbaspirillum galbum]NEX60202.1 hypothetical protein [Noviherbaspirillum galbum]